MIQRKKTRTVSEVSNQDVFSKTRPQSKLQDPSTKYLSNPVNIPSVREARHFFLKHPPKHGAFQVWLGQVEGWRCCCKLAVRGSEDPAIPVEIGLFAPGSVDIIHMTSFRTHAPAINKLTTEIHRGLARAKIRGYDGKNQVGLSYLMFNSCVNHGASRLGRVQVTFVFNETKTNLSRLKCQVETVIDHLPCPDLVDSVWIRCHPTSPHDNNILGRDQDDDSCWDLVRGNEYLLDSLVDLDVFTMKLQDTVVAPCLFFSPMVFRQANLAAFTQIIKEIRNWIPDQSNVVEMYGGIGTIGLHLLDRIASLVCSDENPHNMECFKKSRKSIRNKHVRRKAKYLPLSAKRVVQEFPELVQQANVLVVDPPRKGLEKEVLECFCGLSCSKIVYVSCGFKAFQNDCNELLRRGKYQLVYAKGFVLFPGADHVETLAVFEKSLPR